MMKNLLIIIFLQVSFTLGLIAQQDHFTLTGLTKNIPEKTMVYLMDGETSLRIDSTAIINNQFVFTGDASPYKEYWVMAAYDGKFDYKSLFVENVAMTMDARESDFFNAKVSGSKLQTQADELYTLTKDWQDKAMAVNELMFQVPESNTTKLDSLRQKRTAYFKKSDDLTHQFIKDHPDYLISLKSLTFLKNKISKEETRILYDALSVDFKETSEGQSIKTWLDKSVKLAVGDIAPNFELPNLQGESVELSNFKGKYVLLEFGASGCGPCRMENPNLLKAYEKYQDNGFEILSVWLDKNKDHWTNTVAKDQMIWTTVSDLKGNNGEVPLTYNVIGIPDNYLLNPAGEIIAKDLRGEALEEKLVELFNGQ